jgi:hypothetical protein
VTSREADGEQFAERDTGIRNADDTRGNRIAEQDDAL